MICDTLVYDMVPYFYVLESRNLQQADVARWLPLQEFEAVKYLVFFVDNVMHSSPVTLISKRLLRDK